MRSFSPLVSEIVKEATSIPEATSNYSPAPEAMVVVPEAMVVAPEAMTVALEATTAAGVLMDNSCDGLDFTLCCMRL